MEVRFFLNKGIMGFYLGSLCIFYWRIFWGLGYIYVFFLRCVLLNVFSLRLKFKKFLGWFSLRFWSSVGINICVWVVRVINYKYVLNR